MQVKRVPRALERERIDNKNINFIISERFLIKNPLMLWVTSINRVNCLLSFLNAKITESSESHYLLPLSTANL